MGGGKGGQGRAGKMSIIIIFFFAINYFIVQSAIVGQTQKNYNKEREGAEEGVFK